MVAVKQQNTDEAVDETWQNIAGLQLQLGESVEFYQHVYRNTPWLIIADTHHESYYRCNVEMEYFLKLLDGSRSVEEAWSEASQQSVFTITKQDIVLLIANLQTSHLLYQSSSGNSADTLDKKSGQNPWLRPFAIKFSLFDPDAFLQKTQHWVRPLFSPLAFFIWIMLILIGLITAWMNSAELLEHSQMRFEDPKNLLWYWFLYPLVKALHELGHAFATRIWGGAVHDMGIMLLVFFPVPYVDSSAAHRFSSKNRRLMVSAAGIMVELMLAALALLVWVNTDSGMLHDMAFDIFIIGGVSTLLFNANPLLRFDGYYILQEILEIPNLATRSNQYLGYCIKYYLLDIVNSRSPISAKGESKWMIFYGFSSGLYRIFISLYIAFWVAGKFFIIGLSLAIWSMLSQIIYPAFKNILNLIKTAADTQRLIRLTLVLTLISMVVLLSLLTPVGHSTYAEGVIKLPENATIRAGTDGIITRVLIPDGTSVKAGTVILQLDNLELSAQREILQARLLEARARQKDVILLDRKQADILKARVSTIEAELEDINIQIKSLAVTSMAEGIVFLPESDDLPGRFIKRGEVIGYVANLKQVSARVVIPQSGIDDVRNDSRQIKVILKSRPDEVLSAQLLSELPQMNNQLPSKVLGSGAGGHVAVDARDESGLQTLSNIFQIEVILPLKNSGNYLGQGLYLRFIHSRQSPGSQLSRRINQILMDSAFY